MKFTIIIPSFNQGRFIRRTIDSILRQNSASEVQVIVSDGGSRDETVDILKAYGERITWWSRPDNGYADAVNKCLPLVLGDIVAIQSSDDYYLPGTFTRVSAAFREFPNHAIVSAGWLGIDLDYKIKSVSLVEGDITPRSHLFDILPQHATFIRRDLFTRLGGVRPEVDMCADTDLWYRAAHFGTGIRLKQLAAVYQLHPAQRTATSDKWASSLIRMVESLEALPEYRERFRLSDEDKRNLYAYWRAHWAHAIGQPDAPQLAEALIKEGVSRYGQKTRAMLLYVATRKLSGRVAKVRYAVRHGLLRTALIAEGQNLVTRWRFTRAKREVALRWTEGRAS